jgi:enediyne biosynthesis protein E4
MKYRLLFLFIMAYFSLYPGSGSILAKPCTNHFIEHTLAHTTQTRGVPVHFYEGNGSGVGINDLNNDGLLDIVLGNLKGANTILWNEGQLQFRAQIFGPTGRTRAVNLVDLDADGWLDIVLTTQVGSPQVWHNNHDETFRLKTLQGVKHLAYVLDWSDVDADGDLDLATASYDSELMMLLGNSFLFNSNAGVFYYENRENNFVATQLAEEARGLALRLSDIDEDQQPDLIVGNDFSFPDQSWFYRDGAWIANAPFDVTTYSTMSFDAGDINNDGRLEFFAADMRPAEDDDATQRIWRYVLEDLANAPRLPGDRQITENVLQIRSANGGQTNEAQQYGVAATGWTWSAKFGDLDQDGYLDLYAVNGMESIELFPHVPENALIERNMAFRNDAGSGFTPMPEWGLGSLDGGRGMSMGDLDNDGDLDIVVNNLNAPSALFENDLCGGRSLQVELRWPDSQNIYGIGAKVTLQTSTGTYTRELRASSGYLSGDPSRVHFGFPQETQLLSLEIEWPDHEVTRIEQFPIDPFIVVFR